MTQLFEPIVGGLTVLIIFLGLSSPIIIIGLVYYLKKRLEHKQIMAAIEKGTPLSELRPLKPKGLLWIRSLTAGIAFLVISLPFLYMFFAPLFRGDYSKGGFAEDALYPFAIFFAIGIAFFIRGLLQRKAEMQNQNQLADKNNTTENKKPA